LLNVLCGRLTTWMARMDVYTADELVAKAEGRTKGSLNQFIRADPSLVESVRLILVHHLDAKAGRSAASHMRLPEAVMNKLVEAGHGDSSAAPIEWALHEFMCSAQITKKEFKLATPKEQAHIDLLLRPLFELDVISADGATDGSGGGWRTKLVITKQPVESWCLLSKTQLNHELGRHISTSPKKLTRWEKFCLTKHIQYMLVKQHFLKTFFDSSVSRFLLSHSFSAIIHIAYIRNQVL
jgi:hypothetical protein